MSQLDANSEVERVKTPPRIVRGITKITTVKEFDKVNFVSRKLTRPKLKSISTRQKTANKRVRTSKRQYRKPNKQQFRDKDKVEHGKYVILDGYDKLHNEISNLSDEQFDVSYSQTSESVRSKLEQYSEKISQFSSEVGKNYIKQFNEYSEYRTTHSLIMLIKLNHNLNREIYVVKKIEEYNQYIDYVKMFLGLGSGYINELGIIVQAIEYFNDKINMYARQVAEDEYALNNGNVESKITLTSILMPIAGIAAAIGFAKLTGYSDSLNNIKSMVEPVLDNFLNNKPGTSSDNIPQNFEEMATY